MLPSVSVLLEGLSSGQVPWQACDLGMGWPVGQTERYLSSVQLVSGATQQNSGLFFVRVMLPQMHGLQLSVQAVPHLYWFLPHILWIFSLPLTLQIIRTSRRKKKDNDVFKAIIFFCSGFAHSVTESSFFKSWMCVIYSVLEHRLLHSAMSAQLYVEFQAVSFLICNRIIDNLEGY